MRLFFLLIAGLALGSCRTATPPIAPLVGTSWTLESVIDAGIPVSDVPLDELVFDAEGRGVRVSTCNVCNGLYVVGDRTLEVSQLACTRRACEPGRLELDRYVSGRSRWAIESGRLILTVQDGLNGINAVLTFRRAGA